MIHVLLAIIITVAINEITITDVIAAGVAVVVVAGAAVAMAQRTFYSQYRY